MKSQRQQKNLGRSLRKLLAKPALWFKDLERCDIPEIAGVYLISVRGEPYYIGRTRRLKGRVWDDHFKGDFDSGRLKKYLVDTGECKDKENATQFIKRFARVQWLEVKSLRPRAFLECYATAILQPKHGIAMEH